VLSGAEQPVAHIDRAMNASDTAPGKPTVRSNLKRLAASLPVEHIDFVVCCSAMPPAAVNWATRQLKRLGKSRQS
jgi:hypothetical protein